MRPQEIRHRPGASIVVTGAEKILDGLHRTDQALLLRSRERRKQRRNLRPRARIERREGAASLRGQLERPLSAVRCVLAFPYETALREAAQDTAQVSLVELELSRERRCGWPGALGPLRELIEDAARSE